MAKAAFQLGRVTVETTNYGGHSPEFWAKQATKKICDISSDAPKHIQQQAEAFRDHIYIVILSSIKNAITSDRTSMVESLRRQGHEGMAAIVKQLY